VNTLQAVVRPVHRIQSCCSKLGTFFTIVPSEYEQRIIWFFYLTITMDKIIPKKRWTPKKIGMIAGGVALCGLVAYMTLWSDTRSKLNVERDKITISTVERGAFQEFIPVTGTVMPIRTIYLDAEQGGRVKKVFAEAGAMLKEGDPIVQLSNAQMILDAVNREAQLFEQVNNLQNTRVTMQQTRLNLKQQLIDLENQLARAERAFEQNKRLVENGHVSKEDFARAKDDYDNLRKRLDLTRETMKQDSTLRTAQMGQLERSTGRLESNLGIVKQNLDNMLVRAPVAGQLTSLNAEIGEAKSAGQRLGQIDVLDGFKVRVPIDEFYIARIQVGQMGTCEIAGQTYRLVIRKVYSEVRNGRFEVDMMFESGKGASGTSAPDGVKRGQSLQIRLELGGQETAVLLPRGGFYQKTGGQWAFVVDASGAFAVKRQLRLGRQNPQAFEVMEGLQIGEKVITSSYDSFGDIEKLVLK
jgi:HlyD family secretion protein